MEFARRQTRDGNGDEGHQNTFASRLHFSAGRRIWQRHQLHAAADHHQGATCQSRQSTRGGFEVKLSEMREVLTRRDIQLTKSLGQNFLHDANQLQKIVEAAEISKADKVLEIGPGLGPLTELLLEKRSEERRVG